MLSRIVLFGAFAVLASAQSSVLTFLHVPDPITDGQPQAITYATNDTVNPVSIILRQGPSGNLQTVQTLTTNANNGQYIWTPCKALPDGSNYALEITQGNQVNYFGPFSVQGASEGTCPGISSSSSSSMSASSSGGVGGVAPGPNHSMTSSSNATTTMSNVGSSIGTGVPMHRNTTMSSATLSGSRTHPATNTASMTGTGQPSFSSPAGSSPSSGGAAPDFGQSPLAFILGAVAVVAMA